VTDIAPYTVAALGLVLVLLGTVILWRAHKSKSNPIDFSDLLLDYDGKLSLRKLGELIALLASTWALLWMASLKTLTEGVFGIYIIVWAARSAIGPLISARAGAIALGKQR
jgi:hypothetical protein